MTNNARRPERGLAVANNLTDLIRVGATAQEQDLSICLRPRVAWMPKDGIKELDLPRWPIEVKEKYRWGLCLQAAVIKLFITLDHHIVENDCS